jgi:hypothetical protein
MNLLASKNSLPKRQFLIATRPKTLPFFVSQERVNDGRDQRFGGMAKILRMRKLKARGSLPHINRFSGYVTVVFFSRLL